LDEEGAKIETRRAWASRPEPEGGARRGSQSIARIILATLFVLALGLRLALVLVNREANDDHMAVVARILETGGLPRQEDCWECYQPKLFHLLVALILRAGGLVEADADRQVQAAQWLNLLAGTATLIVVWRVLRQAPARSPVLVALAFGLTALNPALVGINAQATNDSLGILFSSLALYLACSLLGRPRSRDLLLVLLFTTLGISAKANVWVTVFAIVAALLVQAWTNKDLRPRAALLVLLFLPATVLLGILNPLTQYISNYRDYGAPMVLPIKPKALPRLWTETPICPIEEMHGCNPGLLSVRDGLLTFKFVEMIRHPRIEAGRQDFPPHRTSLWSLLYGRAHSLTYNNFPPSWSTTGLEGFALSRAILILALLPSVLLLVGAGMEALDLGRLLRRNAAGARARSYGLFALAFFGYLGFIVVYALQYRDYSFMKPIFLYPALISFPIFFVRAAGTLEAWLAGRARWAVAALEGAIGLLLLLYAVEIVALILQLGDL
jgi:hypothetical protein